MREEGEEISRNELVTGRAGAEALARTRVILFGVGGVGSWCAEGLARAGIGHLTMVDPDRVQESNLNRQLQATRSTLGCLKVEVLAERLRDIRPDLSLEVLPLRYDRETCERFDLDGFDYVIDAIDTLSHKVNLIAQAMASRAVLFSSMGAARKVNPAAVRVASIWRTRHCRLARFVRKRLRRRGVEGECLCVYSEEPPLAPTGEVNGSMVQVTAVFGFFLAGLVIQDVLRRVSGDGDAISEDAAEL